MQFTCKILFSGSQCQHLPNTHPYQSDIPLTKQLTELQALGIAASTRHTYQVSVTAYLTFVSSMPQNHSLYQSSHSATVTSAQNSAAQCIVPLLKCTLQEYVSSTSTIMWQILLKKRPCSTTCARPLDIMVTTNAVHSQSHSYYYMSS